MVSGSEGISMHFWPCKWGVRSSGGLLITEDFLQALCEQSYIIQQFKWLDGRCPNPEGNTIDGQNPPTIIETAININIPST